MLWEQGPFSLRTAITRLPRARLCPTRPNSHLENRVPSLIRFLLIIGFLAGLVYGGMIALVTFVEPQPREMSQSIPPARLNK
jgi:hypothetical protein